MELECPVCGHSQKESAFALSSYCRSCGVYFKIHKGQAIENKPAPINPFGSHRPQTGDGLVPPRERPAPRRRPPDPIREAIFASAAPLETPVEKKTLTGSTTPFSLAAFRNIVCHQCQHTHDISPLATSTVCPRCGLAVSLRDHTINNEWTHNIDTRGDVFIASEGLVHDLTIRCSNLVVEGEFTGTVECSGDFIIRRHGRLPKPVRCNRLIIDDGAEVEFLDTVHADEVIVDGKVTGNIICQGRLTLKEHATLIGDIQISSLAVSEGARHSGLVHTVATH